MDWFVDLVGSVDKLNEDNRDKFCKTLIDNETKNITDVETVRTLLNAAQSLLRLKIEQVESLEMELDDLAAKQGEEEAQHKQQIEDMLNQISNKEPARGLERDGNEADDDLRQALLESELRVEKLLAELQAQEQEQLTNKLEIERLVDQVSNLENERSQLKREVLALREEMREQRRDVHLPPEDFQKTHQQFMDSLRQKNKHISQLLKELEAIEKENLTLREKLDSVKTELMESTKNINRTTGEIAALQLKKDEQTEQIIELQNTCEALRNQVKDLVCDKQKRDTELEIFEKDMESRLLEFKKMVEEKDKELALLYEKLSTHAFHGQTIANESESTRVALLSQTLQKREAQIEDLQAQLLLATKDLTETTDLLEKFKDSSQSSGMKNLPSTQKLTKSSEEEVKILLQKLQDAEKESEEKSEDITQLVVQLRRYETGEFGLTEAVAQIKELSKQKKLRDKHIEELIDSVNMLKNTCDILEEQNLAFRDRLGLLPDEEISINKAALKKEEQHLIENQNKKIDMLEEELVELKLDRRKLSQQVLMLCKKLKHPESSPHQSQKGTAFKFMTRAQADSRVASRKIRKLQQEQQKWEIERQSFIEENEALRQGLHEILDSVHKQDGQSNVLVESKGLENLLQALDSRHVSGWYHPAMRLQAQLNTLEGNNASLREQLRCSRDVEARTQDELLKAKMLISKLELAVNGRQSNTANDPPTSAAKEEDTTFTLCEDSSISMSDIINKLNKHLMQVLHEYEIEKSHVATLLGIQKELQNELDLLVSQLANACQHQKEERERWEEEKLVHQEQIDLVHAQLASYEAQVSQLTSTFTSNDTKIGTVPASVFETAALLAEKTLLERKASSALRQAEIAKEQLKRTKNEHNAIRNKMFHHVGELLNFKKYYSTYLAELENILANSTSVESLDSANKQINELTAKYTMSLHEQEISMTKMSKEIKSLMFELQVERQEKLEALTLLESTRREFEAPSPIYEEFDKDKMVLSNASEVREFSERQRALHAEKMAEFARAELEHVNERCSSLEQEISVLISSNHKLQVKLNSSEEFCSKMITPDERNELETQLAHAKAEVVELQASREQLQEFMDIAQDQINILDNLHDNCEVQLDFFRQTIYELQSQSDHASLVARLNEDLCISQLNQMATLNHVKSLEAEVHRLKTICDHQGQTIDELHKNLNKQKLKSIESTRTLKQRLSDMQERFSGCLPLSFYQITVKNFIQSSSECLELWNKLQKFRAELHSKLLLEEQNKILSCQSLELKNVLSAQHSDIECQKSLESWMSKLTETTLKELKSSRRSQALETQLEHTQERLLKQEDLISALEQQVLSFGAQAVSTYNCMEPGNEDDVIKASTKGKVENDKNIQQKEAAVELPSGNENHKATSPLHINKVVLPVEREQPEDHSRENTKDLRRQVASLEAEVSQLTEQLAKSMEELLSYNKLTAEMRQSHCDAEKHLQLKCEELEKSLSALSPFDNCGAESENDDAKLHSKIALQATVNSLQNIIRQKEETISRYQGLLQDVREEDARIISALQDRLHSLQADLSAQEQAYTRLKNSLRQNPFDNNGGVNTKSAFDAQLTRINELEDEVALLKTKISGLTIELQTAQKESYRWSCVAKQRLVALEEVSQSTSTQKEKGSQVKEPLVHSPINSSGELSNQHGCSSELDRNQKNDRAIDASSRSFDKLSKSKILQLHMHLSDEISSLRSKLQAMEDSERQSKREIQRLRDQIPIYSRRTQRQQSEHIYSEKEADLLKKIQELQEQMLKLKTEAEKNDIQRAQQEFKKIKSAENVARWDERKKYQSQIEKLKLHVQEQADEITLLRDKVERMHSSVHRLEREKVALEQQLKSCLERERVKFEHELKISKETEELQCMLEEVQQDRNKLLSEISILKTEQASDSHDRKEFCEEKIQQENSSLRRSNLALECENLELKLELEKVRAQSSCLQKKGGTTEVDNLSLTRKKQCSVHSGAQIALQAENKKLREKCQDLMSLLDHANLRVEKLEAVIDGSQNSSLVSELQQKTQLLSKVKVLLERAALKERALSEQVLSLQEIIARKR